MTTIVLDTHVLHWWSSDPDLLSDAAARVLRTADDLAVAAISWFELAWLAQRGRISLAVPVDTWLDGLSSEVRTIGITPAIAHTAVSLPATFPSDPADRLIFATAVQTGSFLVTKDRRLLDYQHPRKLAVW